MELILLIVIAALAVISIVLSLAKGNNHAQAEQLQAALRQQMQENREELNRSIRELRMEMTQVLNQNMQQLQHFQPKIAGVRHRMRCVKL